VISARIGETLKLEKQDFKLDADLPSVDIKAEYTKGGVGGRTVYFSYEARDAIKDCCESKTRLIDAAAKVLSGRNSFSMERKHSRVHVKSRKWQGVFSCT